MAPNSAPKRTAHPMFTSMVDVIRTAAAAEQRAGFVAEAQAARAEAIKSGCGYAATEVHAYLAARAQGKSVAKPKAKSWRST